MLPSPGALRNWISPPSRLANSRLMASPRPVPPYLRLVPAAARWEAPEEIRWLFERNANAGVGNFKGHHRRRLAQDGVPFRPTAPGQRHGHAYASEFGELK